MDLLEVDEMVVYSDKQVAASSADKWVGKMESLKVGSLVDEMVDKMATRLGIEMGLMKEVKKGYSRVEQKAGQ